MTALPLIAHCLSEDVLAWADGAPVTAGRFLADARRLAASFPPGRHVLNASADRYRFAVGMAAALISDRISLLPPALTPEMVRQVRQFAPDVFCLTDQAQAIDLPQIAWGEAMAGVTQDTGAFDIPSIPAASIAAIVFTSGSTGLPVAHRKSWGGLVRSVRAEAQRLGLLDGRRHSIVATVAPQHMYGFESTVLIALHNKNGDIYQPEFMETLRKVEGDAFFIPGVDRARVTSIFSPSALVRRAWNVCAALPFRATATFQYSSGTKASISRSRSTIIRSVTDCTRPADLAPGSLRHSTGDRVKPTR